MQWQAAGPLQECDVDCTSAQQAVSRDHMPCLQLLLARDSSLAIKLDEHGESALHLIDHSEAPHFDEFDVAPRCYAYTAALLAAAATPALAPATRTALNALDRSGKLALHKAAVTAGARTPACHHCLRALAAAGADASESRCAERSLLHALLHDKALDATDDCCESEDFDELVQQSAITLRALQQAGLVTAGTGALHASCQRFDSECAVKLLLACGADVHERNSAGLTALHVAAEQEFGHEVMPLLIAADGSGSLLRATTERDSRTALHFAATFNEQHVQLLLQHGAEADAADAAGMTPLHAACASNDGTSAALVTALIAAGVDVQRFTTGHDGIEGQWQPIHYAVSACCENDEQLQAIDALLAAGASVNAATSDGCSPAWLVGLLAYSKLTSHCAVRMDALLQRGADLQYYTEQYGSLLHAAAGGGNTDMMNLLLERGLVLSNTDAKNVNATGYTPLLMAAIGDHTAMVQLLIEKGCDVHATTSAGETALQLYMSGSSKDAECCRVLLDAGCDPLVVTDEG
jgi:ankyrin repeat protein